MLIGQGVRIRGRTIQQINDAMWRDRRRHPELYAVKRFVRRTDSDGSVVVRRVE
jgi:hypothetical protein